MLTDKRIVITGGTGSLGKVLVHRLLSGEMGQPAKIVVFSRDEAKQHAMRLTYQRCRCATDEVIYRNFQRLLEFWIGDVRDFRAVTAVLRDADLVVNAAALKQVPACEYFPSEAVQTNVNGAENIIRAIRENNLRVDTVIGVSTDKACKPVCVMGMTKALQERIFLRANLDCPDTRLMGVRYGNVLASRGSVVPLFHEQIRQGGPVTVTTPEMTRFFLSLHDAVDTIFAAFRTGQRGDLFVPRVPAARMIDVARVVIGNRPITIKYTGIRPGEKIHEILVSEEEANRTTRSGDYYVIQPILPELRPASDPGEKLSGEYSSAHNLMSAAELRALFQKHRLLIEDVADPEEELVA
ncbi:polysaccharide biosynthesis protein [Planctomycetaceae bacterium SCGC AG-212-F19]|nr:polysaccharide biosynthesis protein [Planctomycetaceae bacterium SCGC AG-212-F19]